MLDMLAEEPRFNYAEMRRSLSEPKTDDQLFQAIVNTPFLYPPQAAFLFLGIVVLLLANRKTGNIDRVGLSNTELAKNTTDVSYVPFEQIKVPLDDPENIIAKAIASGKPQDTTDWKYLFTPALTPEQARINQASGGIAYSAVYPLVGARDGGALIFSYFQYMSNIGQAQKDFMAQYSELATASLKA